MITINQRTLFNSLTYKLDNTVDVTLVEDNINEYVKHTVELAQEFDIVVYERPDGIGIASIETETDSEQEFVESLPDFWNWIDLNS